MALASQARRLTHDGTPVYLPDAAGRYPGVWSRDLAYVARAGAIPVDDLRAAFEFIMKRQRADGAVPDHVMLDGSPVYTVAGALPPTDNPQALVSLALVHHQMTASPTLFARYAPALERAMASIPRDASGMVWIDPRSPHSSYGFTDWVVGKTGRELFTSLLFIRAARDMQRLYEASEDADGAIRWRSAGERVSSAISALWDDQRGLFLAAEGEPLPDIWGNAYAVAEGIATPDQATRIVEYFRSNHRAFVARGQVRHLPAPSQWGALLSPLKVGTYQQGGYWATATGWMVKALAPTDPDLAELILREAVADFRANGVNEWINDGSVCMLGIGGYVASAAGPLQG